MNPSTALATVLVDELIRCGVREAVLAPGSRSAPLAFALHAADAEGRLRLHVRIDERSAGFLALGLAKVSRRAVPVVTTSGTAAANLHPAVLEASESGVALVLLTADRPPELRGVGANQTIDQIKLYGDAVQLFHEVGVPEARAGQNAYWRSLVCRATAMALGHRGDPGPVHLNLAFREPLVPEGGADPWPESLEGREGVAPWTAVEPATPPPPTGMTQTDDGLLIVGDVAPPVGEAAVLTAESFGWPIVAEPSSNARRGPNAVRLGHLLVGRADLKPCSVCVVGRPTLTRGVLSLLRDPDVKVHVVSRSPAWADATSSALTVSAELPYKLGHEQPDTRFLERWKSADAEAVAAADLASWSGPSIASALFAALPQNALLIAGSSLAVRDLQYAAPRDGVTVVANRGVSGIDGTVSTATGAALAWQVGGGGPAYALLGDLTFLHDANGLLLGPQEPLPRLTIVVVNNDGGGIFAGLEPGRPEHARAFERVFGTPTGADLAALCGASCTPYTRVTSLDDLVNTALDPRNHVQVIEAAGIPR
jgi:2-succinyl-5-enolpyruvyl-6-hydroxy-3-cyclohexene-1-carboxylate synthase